jgi:hypothetical protein
MYEYKHNEQIRVQRVLDNTQKKRKVNRGLYRVLFYGILIAIVYAFYIFGMYLYNLEVIP